MSLTDEKKHQILREITQAAYRGFSAEFDKFILIPKISEADVISMVMNAIVSTSKLMYFELKALFPKKELDYKFLKVSIINAIADEFEKIKTHRREQELSPDQVLEIIEKGSTTVELEDGTKITAKKEDLRISAEDAEKLKSELLTAVAEIKAKKTSIIH